MRRTIKCLSVDDVVTNKSADLSEASVAEASVTESVAEEDLSVDAAANRSSNNPYSTTTTAAPSRSAPYSTTGTAVPSRTAHYSTTGTAVPSRSAPYSTTSTAVPSRTTNSSRVIPAEASRVPSVQSRMTRASSRVHSTNPSAVAAASSNQSRIGSAKTSRVVSARSSKKSSMAPRTFKSSRLVSQLPSRITEVSEPDTAQPTEHEFLVDSSVKATKSSTLPSARPSRTASAAAVPPSIRPSRVSYKSSRVKESVRSTPDVQSRLLMSASPSRVISNSPSRNYSQFNRPSSKQAKVSSRRVWSNHSSAMDNAVPSKYSATSALR